MKSKCKKIIVILSIFFLSFSIVTDYKQKEAEAFVVLDDITILILGLTVLATGYVAVNKDQIYDMGSRVYDELKENAEISLDASLYLADLAKDGAVKVTNTLIDAIKEVVKNIPNDDVEKVSPFDLPVDMTLDIPFNSGTYGKYDYDTAPVSYSITILNSGERDTSIVISGNESRVDFIDCRVGTTKIKFNGYYRSDSDWKYGVFSYIKYPSGGITSGGQLSEKNPFSMKIHLNSPDLKIVDSYSYVTIPYSNSKIKENYNPTVINERFDLLVPDRSISIDKDAVVTSGVLDRTITEDDVLSWDAIKDLYITQDGTITNPDDTTTGTIDKVVDNVFNPTITKSLDFSPLYLSFSDKFPFSIPFDIYNLISDFKAEKKAPKFYIDLSPFSMTGAKSSAGFELDFTKFSVLFGIARTFILISFIVFLAIKTRDIIKG